jgi:hypothetical protein
MKLNIALVGLAALGTLLRQEPRPHCHSPHFPQFRTLRASLWSAARMVVSARRPLSAGEMIQ